MKIESWLLTFLIFVLVGVIFTSCSEKDEEDPIVYDLNEIFDPKHAGYTDWNYTEIEQDWLDEAGLYYDSSINEYRQKSEYVKNKKKHSHKPMNPITGRILQFIAVWVSINAFLVYCARVQAKKLHRQTGLWMINCFIGGVPSFIVLSISPSLKYHKDLEIREEPDLLGQVIFYSNLSVVVMVYIIISTYIMILKNPDVLIDFVGK